MPVAGTAGGQEVAAAVRSRSGLAPLVIAGIASAQAVLAVVLIAGMGPARSGPSAAPRAGPEASEAAGASCRTALPPQDVYRDLEARAEPLVREARYSEAAGLYSATEGRIQGVAWAERVRACSRALRALAGEQARPDGPGDATAAGVGSSGY